MLTPWNKDRILVDPFCGSGTFPIEAALIAADIAPGIARSFLATTDIAAIRKKMRLKRIISGLLLTLLLIWGIFVVCEFLRSYETRSGYGIDREVVIISRAEDEATATDATTTNTDD